MHVNSTVSLHIQGDTFVLLCKYLAKHFNSEGSQLAREVLDLGQGFAQGLLEVSIVNFMHRGQEVLAQLKLEGIRGGFGHASHVVDEVFPEIRLNLATCDKMYQLINDLLCFSVHPGLALQVKSLPQLPQARAYHLNLLDDIRA